MNASFSVQHVAVDVARPFDEFTQQLEIALGRLDRLTVAQTATHPAYVEARLRQMGGAQDLILFGVEDHGQLFALLGEPPRQLRQYSIGNPLIALQMTQHDERAALYAPLRVLVYAGPGQASTRVEYDLPSDLFGQFGNAEVTRVAKGLDDKLAALLQQIGPVKPVA